MLTATLLLAAIAATVPDEAVLPVDPLVTDTVEAVVDIVTEVAPPVDETSDENLSATDEDTDLTLGTVRTRVAIPHRARDAQPTASTSIVIKAPIDAAPPVVVITTPTANPITSVVGNPLMISGTATDDVAVASVKWQLTGPRTGNGTLPTTAGAWTHTFTSLVVGTYKFTVTATDTVGKPSTAVVRTITITRAGTPPPTDPPPDPGNDNSGDIKKDVKKCGIGGGIATFLLLFGSLAALMPKRRIE